MSDSFLELLKDVVEVVGSAILEGELELNERMLRWNAAARHGLQNGNPGICTKPWSSHVRIEKVEDGCGK
jgi:hydroxymethylglutaryl-CoA reductase